LALCALRKVLGAISIVLMKTSDLTITELAASVPKAVRETEQLGVRGITVRGKAVAFLVSREVMESILETMELQKNSRLMELVKADRAGKVAFARIPDED
jgi:hypothetical protein